MTLTQPIKDMKKPKYKRRQWVRFYNGPSWQEKRRIFKGCIEKSWEAGQTFLYNIGRNKRTYWCIAEDDIIEVIEPNSIH